MIVGAIQTVVEGRSLSRDTAHEVMEAILTGGVTPAQFGALVTALRLKGESADEIAGFLESMRAHATRVDLGDLPAVDACGTGGRGVSWFNVTTTAALVAAGAGAKVAKHGNRSFTRKSGSADALEALGVQLAVAPAVVARCVREAGVGFMFAQAFHPSMKFAAPLRREIGTRTVFNRPGSPDESGRRATATPGRGQSRAGGDHGEGAAENGRRPRARGGRAWGHGRGHARRPHPGH